MYYELKIKHSANDDDYPEMARCYMAMLQDLGADEDEDEDEIKDSEDALWMPLLRKLIW